MDQTRGIGFWGTGPPQLVLVVPTLHGILMPQRSASVAPQERGESGEVLSYWDIKPPDSWKWCAAVYNRCDGWDAILMDWKGAEVDIYGHPDSIEKAPDDPWIRHVLSSAVPNMVVRGHFATARRVKISGLQEV